LTPMRMPASGWLSPSQVASRFGVSTDTVRYWGRTGRLREYRTPAGHRRYRTEDVEALASGTTGENTPNSSSAKISDSSSPPPVLPSPAPKRNEKKGNKETETEPAPPPPWERRVLEAEAKVEVLKAEQDREELIEAKRRKKNAEAEKAAAATAAEREARRLNTLKDHGRLHANLKGGSPVFRAKVGRALEQYVTSENFPPGLRDTEAFALVGDHVDRVLRRCQKKRAKAETQKEDRLRVEGLIERGKSLARMRTLLWEKQSRDEVQRAVEAALGQEVEANWTKTDVSELIDEVLEDWEEEELEEDEY